MRDSLVAGIDGQTNEVELIEGSGGAFEITRDGNLVFSKYALKRFPNEDEVKALLG